MTNKYREIQQLKLAGKVIGYPFYLSSPKLGKFVPSIPKGKSIHITANTSVSKSQFWKWYFLAAPYILYKQYPDSNFKPKWFIFLLEESYEQLYDGLISMFVFIKYQKIVTPSLLTGFTQEITTDEELRLVDLVTPIVEDLLSYCTIRENIYNPTGIYRTCRDEIILSGKRFYTTLVKSELVIPEEDYNKLPDTKKLEFKFKNYVQNDDSEYVFIIVDNLNLLESEKENGIMLDLQSTMWKWSTDYAHKQLQKNLHAICIDIIQQSAASEQKQFTTSGKNIVEKLKPTRDDYGDNKRIARNADIIFGLFAPTFYGITEYSGYNLQQIGDYFRSVIILKNRIGVAFKEIPLFFNGGTNYYTELPTSLTGEKLELVKKGLYYQGFRKLN